MGAPLDKFLRKLYGGHLKSISSLTICLLYGGGGVGGPRSVSSLTIWGLPQVCFFAYYMGAPSDQFLRLLYGAPLDKFLCIRYGALQVGFFAYYRGGGGGALRSVSSQLYGGPSDQFLCILYGGPFRPVSLHTIWGPLRISFFAYYKGP